MSTAPGPATGVLSDKPLAHLFVHMHDERLSGTLELTATGGSAVVALIDGHVAKVRTSAPVAYLGSVLYEFGFVDDAELNTSLQQLSQRGQLHGQILLERGAITRAQLDVALREQTLRKLAHLFSFDSLTTFAFHRDVDLLASYGAASEGVIVDPYPALWRGIRDRPSEEHVRKVLAGRRAYGLAPWARLERFCFRGPEPELIEFLRIRPCSLADLQSLRLLPPKTTALLVYCLLITKQLSVFDAALSGSSLRPALPRAISEVRQRAAPSASAAPGSVSGAPAARASDPRREPYDPAPDIASVGATSAINAAKACIARRDFERAERLARHLRERNPRQALPLALLAWAEAMSPSNAGVDATRVRVTMLTRALAMDSECDEALYYRAQLHKRLGNHRAAIRDLNEVVSLNPRNIDAMRELRIYEMRVRNGSLSMQAVRPQATSGVRSQVEPGGLFGRLLKRR